MTLQPQLGPPASWRNACEPFHVMTKPIGPMCNLDCRYCFYLEKERLYSGNDCWKMPDLILEEYIRQYIASQGGEEVSFAWQGGEPTLLGIDFFRHAVALQKKYGGGRRISNAFQTNGTLLDDEWGRFFRENGFLVGISIDGPPGMHDSFRVDKQQRSTFDAVKRGLNVLKTHGVEFNTLTVVNNVNVRQPLELYHFLKHVGSGFIQFIPLVERTPELRHHVLKMTLAEPPSADTLAEENLTVTPWSVDAAQYGTFLTIIFDQWIRHDVGKVFVQLFDVVLGAWVGVGGGLCVFAEKCGRALAVEHNGDIYSCDHYVYPAYRLGNLMTTPLREMVDSPQQLKFGMDKSSCLPAFCRKCEFRFACNGGCPKHRFTRAPDGEAGLNYLCPSYKLFFSHVAPYMKTMATLITNGLHADQIMSIVQQQQRHQPNQHGEPRPNDPCPCGCGLKFKKCCGSRRDRR